MTHLQQSILTELFYICALEEITLFYACLYARCIY
jgi:hypothetical protein